MRLCSIPLLSSMRIRDYAAAVTISAFNVIITISVAIDSTTTTTTSTTTTTTTATAINESSIHD